MPKTLKFWRRPLDMVGPAMLVGGAALTTVKGIRQHRRGPIDRIRHEITEALPTGTPKGIRPAHPTRLLAGTALAAGGALATRRRRQGREHSERKGSYESTRRSEAVHS
jgi:hypothetical protein